jgi:phosphoesterase RecJ-like protein
MRAEFGPVLEKLSGLDNFLIITHQRPDGDALGSSLAFLNILLTNGKKAELFLPDPVPEHYLGFLPDSNVIYQSMPDLTDYSAFVCLDTSDEKRVGLGCSSIKDLKAPVINIDHHPDNTGFGDIKLIIPTAAAASEIVFHLFASDPGNWKIDSASAEKLMLGLVMDTGAFRFDNTKSETFEVASKLMAFNIDYSGIIRKMFFSKSAAYVRFEADLLLNQLNYAFESRFAWINLSVELLARHGIDLKDIEGLIDSVRAVDGVQIAALLVEKETEFKVSLRSKNPTYSVGKVARILGGGGHELAAGASIEAGSMQDAEKILISEVERIFTNGQTL